MGMATIKKSRGNVFLRRELTIDKSTETVSESLILWILGNFNSGPRSYET